MQSLSEQVKRLIDRANFAHLSTLMSDGAPQVAPVWIMREGNRLLVGTGSGTLKARNCARDPRIALAIVDMENPYREVQIRGRVVELRDDNDMTGMDAISMKYTGKPFPFRQGTDRVLLVIEADKVRYSELPFEYPPPSSVQEGMV